MTAAGGLDLVVFNEATREPIVFAGRPASVRVRIDNNTGGALGFATGAGASTLRIYPPDFYTRDERHGMSIALTGWDFAVDDHDGALVLTCRVDPGPLGHGQSMAITIAGATSAGPARANATGEGQLLVTLDNVSGNVPPELQAPLRVSAPSPPDHLPLPIHPSLENGGIVYVSKPGDPLANTIVLRVTNTGPDKLYVGPAPRPGDARITVSFVYGTTSGALAQDTGKDNPPIGSAWRIRAEPRIQQGGPWTVENPRDAPLRWILKPSGTNQSVLGTGSEASATFAFREIVSFTPPGPTQMTLEMTGFARDETTSYDTATIRLDIDKRPALARGLQTFFAVEATVTVTRPDQPVPIDLRWRMFGVAKVKLVNASRGGAEIWSKDYSASPDFLDAPLLAGDRQAIALPGVSSSGPVVLSLEAYGGSGALLNALPCQVFIDARMLVDPADGHVYPAIRSGNRLWMAANLKREVAGARPGLSGNLYPASLAAEDVPPPWRLPRDEDWQALVAAFPTAEAAYAALIAGGAAGFNATLDGHVEGNDAWEAGESGQYWSATPDALDGGQQRFAAFSPSRRVVLGSSFPRAFALAVRWVRDV